MTKKPQKIKIGAVKDFPPNSSRKFTYLHDKQKKEGLVVNWHGELHAYENLCQHLSLTLDLDDNDFFDYSGKFLVCKTHGAFYKPDTGKCVAGPPIGKSLHSLPVLIKDDEIFVEIPS